MNKFLVKSISCSCVNLLLQKYISMIDITQRRKIAVLSALFTNCLKRPDCIVHCLLWHEVHELFRIIKQPLGVIDGRGRTPRVQKGIGKLLAQALVIYRPVRTIIVFSSNFLNDNHHSHFKRQRP